MENHFSFKRKTTGQTSNQFHYYQINYNISYVCLTVKKKKSLLFFFTLAHIHSLCVSRPKKKNLFFFFALIHTLLWLTVKEKPSWYYLLSHTLILSREQQHFALSSLTIFSSSFSYPHSFP